MVGCARPTCDAVAEVGLGYDAVRRVAWLATLDDGGAALLALCTTHAEQVTLPHGWIGRDERSTQPRLWLPAAEPHAATRGADVVPLPVRSKRRRVLDDGVVVEELPLWADAHHDPAGHLAGDLYGGHPPVPAAGSATRRRDADEDQPHSPLLARAFRAAGLG